MKKLLTSLSIFFFFTFYSSAQEDLPRIRYGFTPQLFYANMQLTLPNDGNPCNKNEDPNNITVNYSGFSFSPFIGVRLNKRLWFNTGFNFGFIFNDTLENSPNGIFQIPALITWNFKLRQNSSYLGIGMRYSLQTRNNLNLNERGSYLSYTPSKTFVVSCEYGNYDITNEYQEVIITIGNIKKLEKGYINYELTGGYGLKNMISRDKHYYPASLGENLNTSKFYSLSLKISGVLFHHPINKLPSKK